MAEDLRRIITQVAKESQAAAKAPEKLVQFIVFSLDQEKYAVEITDLKEVIKIPNITPIPNAPEFIRGIFNLRGKIVVVIDLEKRFHLAREHPVAPRHLAITEINGSSFGVIVDEVTEIVRVSVNQIRPAPELVSTKIHADYLEGVVVIEEEAGAGQKESNLLIILDLPKLLQEKELLALSETINEINKK